jgi:maleate cis-trans isomerase
VAVGAAEAVATGHPSPVLEGLGSALPPENNMKGWRARLGFLVPPGNPTVEPEMMAMTPPGVSVHFSRLVARGAAGTHGGQTERNRSQIEHIDESAALLAMVKPDVIVLAHTATSYTLGRSAEAALLQRLQAEHAVPFVTAFGSVAAALGQLAVKRIAFGTPYSEDITRKGKAHLEEHGFDVVSHGRLENVANIYDLTAESAYLLGRKVDSANAQAIFLSGTGMPTIEILEALERDLGKPAISANSAMMWHALELAGVHHPILGFGRLLASARNA